MTIFVSVGPTLARRDIERRIPAVQLIPPVGAGDVVSLDWNEGDVLVVIDGLFRERGSVRHSEILEALAEGLRVIGVSSIGALRAAELHEFGMEGSGDVFRAYLSDVLKGDDEVAILHGPAPEYIPLTLPLVNLRVSFAEAVVKRQIERRPAQDVLASLKDLPFQMRSIDTVARLISDATGVDAGLNFVRQIYVDQKQIDARQVVDDIGSGRLLASPRSRDKVYAAKWAPSVAHLRLRQASQPVAEDGSASVGLLRVVDAARMLDEDFPSYFERVCERAAAAFLAEQLGWPQPAPERLLRGFVEDEFENARDFEPWLAERALTREELLELLRDEAASAALKERGFIGPDSTPLEMYLEKFGFISREADEASLDSRWLSPHERTSLPAVEMFARVAVRAMYSARLIPRLGTELKIIGAFETAARRAMLVNRILLEASKRGWTPPPTALADLRLWLAGTWGVSVEESRWAALDRGFRNERELRTTATDYFVVSELSSHRLTSTRT